MPSVPLCPSPLSALLSLSPSRPSTSASFVPLPLLPLRPYRPFTPIGAPPLFPLPLGPVWPSNRGSHGCWVTPVLKLRRAGRNLGRGSAGKSLHFCIPRAHSQIRHVAGVFGVLPGGAMWWFGPINCDRCCDNGASGGPLASTTTRRDVVTPQLPRRHPAVTVEDQVSWKSRTTLFWMNDD